MQQITLIVYMQQTTLIVYMQQTTLIVYMQQITIIMYSTVSIVCTMDASLVTYLTILFLFTAKFMEFEKDADGNIGMLLFRKIEK